MWGIIKKQGLTLINGHTSFLFNDILLTVSVRLNSDLSTKYNKNYYDWSTLSLAAVLNKLFTDVHTSYGSYTSMIQCTEGYFSVWGFRTTTGYCGTATSGGTAYAFDGKAGADPVLKKLGSGITTIDASTAMPLTFGLDGVQTMTVTVTSTATYTGLSVTGKKSDGTSVTLIAGTNNASGLTVGAKYTLDVSALSQVTARNSGSNYASFRIEFE